MSDEDIIKLYQRGNSIDFIVDTYYRYRNSTVKENFYSNGNFVVTKKNISKKDARIYVSDIILKHITKKGL